MFICQVAGVRDRSLWSNQELSCFRSGYTFSQFWLTVCKFLEWDLACVYSRSLPVTLWVPQECQCFSLLHRPVSSLPLWHFHVTLSKCPLMVNVLEREIHSASWIHWFFLNQAKSSASPGPDSTDAHGAERLWSLLASEELTPLWNVLLLGFFASTPIWYISKIYIVWLYSFFSCYNGKIDMLWIYASEPESKVCLMLLTEGLSPIPPLT